MKAILVEMKPYDAPNDVRKTLRITNVNDPKVTLVSGGSGEYLPLLCAGPMIARSLFNGDFTGGGSAPQSELSVRLDEETLHEWMSYVWGDADVTIWQGNSGDAFSSYTKIWTLRAESIERRDKMATIVIKPPAQLNRPLLYLSFAGTDDGDSGDTGEGRVEVRGMLKPWLSGTARFVPPVLIDAARQIYCYHGYGPTEGVTACFEGGVSKGDPTYTWASFAAMRDQAMTSAEWGHCPSIGMIRLGGAPSFPITIHASGDKPGGSFLAKTADIVKRILEGPGGITAPAVPATTVTELNELRPEAMDFYVTSQMTVEQALTVIMLAANGYWLENESGQIILGLLTPNLQGQVTDLTTQNDLSASDENPDNWTLTGTATKTTIRSFVRVTGTSGGVSKVMTTTAGQNTHLSARVERTAERSGGSELAQIAITNGASSHIVNINPKTGDYTATGIDADDVIVEPAGDSWLVGMNIVPAGSSITVELLPVAP